MHLTFKYQNKSFTEYVFFIWRATSPRQCPLDPPLGSKPQIHDRTHQNRVLGNPGKLLMGIEPNMFNSTAHHKPPTTRLYPEGVKVVLNMFTMKYS